jgi:YD repeat-containing protein
MNRLSKVTDPLGKFETFQYDGNGNLVSTTDRKGQAISFEYDAANQLLKKTLPGNLVTSFGYDLGGNLTSVTDPDSQLAFAYNGANQLKFASTAGSSSQPTLELTYGYFDRNGQRTVIADSLSGGSFVEYTTREFDRLTSMFLPAFSSNITFSYDNLNRRSSMTLPNGVVTNYSYDAASQPGCTLIPVKNFR